MAYFLLLFIFFSNIFSDVVFALKEKTTSKYNTILSKINNEIEKRFINKASKTVF